MRFLALLALAIVLQLLVLVPILRRLRRRKFGRDPECVEALIGKVFLLALAVQLLTPVLGVATVVIWILGLVRLAGMDALSTCCLAFTVGFVHNSLFVWLAHSLHVQLPGGP